MEIGAPSGPDLATLPLYSEAESPLFPGLPKVANVPAADSNAARVQRQALSLPTFNNWPEDKSLIDDYIVAFQKIYQNHSALVDYARSA